MLPKHMKAKQIIFCKASIDYLKLYIEAIVQHTCSYQPLLLSLKTRHAACGIIFKIYPILLKQLLETSVKIR